MIVDASAIVAILLRVPGHKPLQDRLDAASRRMTHGLSVYEAVLAYRRETGVSPEQSREDVQEFLRLARIATVPLGEDETAAALDAHARYGRGRGHPARLNMGDCFSYACARTRGLPLLYKGEDFAQTDLA